MKESEKKWFDAARAGRIDEIETLYRSKDIIDLDLKEPKTGMTAMHIACAHDDAAMVKFLYGLGALTTVEDNYGRTPKKVATFMGRAYRALVVAERFEMDHSMLDM